LSPSDEMPFKVTNYLFVTSIDAAAAKVKEFGGKLLNEKAEVGDMGWMQHFEDPEGNLVALWQAKTKG
jgi:predicted enzyme related to lactoylglutathione lyase